VTAHPASHCRGITVGRLKPAGVPQEPGRTQENIGHFDAHASHVAANAVLLQDHEDLLRSANGEARYYDVPPCVQGISYGLYKPRLQGFPVLVVLTEIRTLQYQRHCIWIVDRRAL